jgi:peptide/nickel transport system ATP-binding protein
VIEDLSLRIGHGETLGIVGPSGCGKSTLARVIARLTPADAGRVIFAGEDWLQLSPPALRRHRRLMQMVFQDPLTAFHPRASVTGALAPALRLQPGLARCNRPRRQAELLEQVGLDPALDRRAVSTLSGGQRQRLAIARAIATEPRLIILDEAVSALDTSIRRQILELLVRLQRELGLAYLFIGHDLAVVRAISHRIAVMAGGRIIETGETEALIARPATALLAGLIAAVPPLHPAPSRPPATTDAAQSPTPDPQPPFPARSLP